MKLARGCPLFENFAFKERFEIIEDDDDDKLKVLVPDLNSNFQSLIFLRSATVTHLHSPICFTNRQVGRGRNWSVRCTDVDGNQTQLTRLPSIDSTIIRQLQQIIFYWEVVVAQLVERSLMISEVRGSTPVIDKILLNICLLSTVLKRRK